MSSGLAHMYNQEIGNHIDDGAVISKCAGIATHSLIMLGEHIKCGCVKRLNTLRRWQDCGETRVQWIVRFSKIITHKSAPTHAWTHHKTKHIFLANTSDLPADIFRRLISIELSMSYIAVVFKLASSICWIISCGPGSHSDKCTNSTYTICQLILHERA